MQATLNVGGNIINAQAIEHFILRKRDISNVKEVNNKNMISQFFLVLLNTSTTKLLILLLLLLYISKTMCLVLQVQRKGEWEEKESFVRELYGLEFNDPNVTFALCCGTRSSPAVSPFAQEHIYLLPSFISINDIFWPILQLDNILLKVDITRREFAYLIIFLNI